MPEEPKLPAIARETSDCLGHRRARGGAAANWVEPLFDALLKDALAEKATDLALQEIQFQERA